MKHKAILAALALLICLPPLNAQEDDKPDSYTWGPGMEYGWGKSDIISRYIDRNIELKLTYTHIPVRSKDSIVFIEDFPTGYVKTTCYLKDDSLHTVRYDEFGQRVNEDPVNMFYSILKERELEPYWLFDTYLVTDTKMYSNFNRSDIPEYLEVYRASIYASRLIANTFSEIMLTYEDDGYHIHYMFRQLW